MSGDFDKHPVGRSTEERLYLAYSTEKELYIEVLLLARKLRDALKTNKPMSEVVGILRKKKEIMDRIDSLENVIEEEKIDYRNGASDPGRISGLIEDLSSLIEEILAVERENEVLFTTSSSRGLKRTAPCYTPELAVSMYAMDIREVEP